MSGDNGMESTAPQGPVPKHVAIIMDGNGRWAKAKHLPRVEGHRAGVKTVRTIVEESRKLGIKYLTLFAFSTENWHRPEEEVSSLMKLFCHFLDAELSRLMENGVRLRVIGDKQRLPAPVRELVVRNEEKTSHLNEMSLVLAISYGGRDEIARAAKRIAEKVESGLVRPSEIDEALIQANLDAPDIPDPDLLIRTSDENRISNFLLWQLAYSEIVLSRVLWPDFTVAEYRRCLNEFAGRTRRFGLTDEQLQNGN